VQVHYCASTDRFPRYTQSYPSMAKMTA